MVKNILSIFLLLYFSAIFSQNKDSISIDYPVWPICKLIPQKLQKKCFEESLEDHIEKYKQYPEQVKNLNLQSIVNVFFEIDELGLTSNIRIKSNLVGVKFSDKEALLSANQIFEDATLKIISKIPKLQPGKINDSISSIPYKISVIYKMPSKKDDLNQIFSIENVEWPPLLPGCTDMDLENSKKCFKEKLNSFINKNVRYPRKAKDSGIKSIVFVEITIENDGSIYSYNILGPEIFRKESERLIKKIPILEPGFVNDNPVAVTYTIPIVFESK